MIVKIFIDYHFEISGEVGPAEKSAPENSAPRRTRPPENSAPSAGELGPISPAENSAPWLENSAPQCGSLTWLEIDNVFSIFRSILTKL